MSLDIKYIKDTEGNNYFPVVHEKGVVDDNGTTLESKLQSKQDAISDIETIRSGAAAGATAVQPATTLAGYGITDGYTKTEGQTLESTVDNRLDDQDAAIALLNGSEVIVVADHTQVASPNSQKIYREQGSTSYTDWMYQDSTWKEIATYNFPGIDGEPTAGSNNLVKSGGVADTLGYTTESSDYIKLIKDEANHLLFGIKINGDIEWGKGVPTPIKNYITELLNEKENNYLKGKTIVCFGDSITEFYGLTDRKRYSDYIADYTGATVINVGIGGTCLRERANPVIDQSAGYRDSNYAALDIVNMVRAACDVRYDENYTYLQLAQIAAEYIRNNRPGGDDNTRQVQILMNIDWSKVDYITVFAGTNDWKSNRSKWGESGSHDADTTMGAINEIISLISSTFKHVKLFWFTPIIRWNGYDGTPESKIKDNFSDYFTYDGVTLKELSAEIQREVSLNHIPVCDLYNGLGWNMDNFSEYFGNDTTHPYYGFSAIARKIVDFIKSGNSNVREIVLTELYKDLSEKVDKEEGKGLIDAEFAEGVSQAENLEFVEAHIDAEDKILYGVKKNGDFYFGAGVPSQVQEELDNAAEVVGNKVDKEDGKGLIDNQYVEEVEHDELIKATCDVEGKVLQGIKKDGSPYFPHHEIMKVDEIPGYNHVVLDNENRIVEGIDGNGRHVFNAGIEVSQLKTENGIESNDWLDIKTDSEGRILEGINKDGEKHISKFDKSTQDLIKDFAGGGSDYISIPMLDANFTSPVPVEITGTKGSDDAKYVFDLPLSDDAFNIRFKFRITENILNQQKSCAIASLGNYTAVYAQVTKMYQVVRSNSNDNTKVSYWPALQGGVSLNGSNIGRPIVSGNLNIGLFAFSVKYVGQSHDVTIENNGESIILSIDGNTTVFSFSSYQNISELYEALSNDTNLEVSYRELESHSCQDLAVFSPIKLVSQYWSGVNGSASDTIEEYWDAAPLFIPYAVDNTWHQVEIVKIGNSIYSACDGVVIVMSGSDNLLTLGGGCGVLFKDFEVYTKSVYDAEYISDKNFIISSANPHIVIHEGHGIDKVPHYKGYITDNMATTIDRLQLIYSAYKAKGYVPVSINDVAEYYAGNKNLPKRCYVTIYDDYRYENCLDLENRSVHTKFGVKPALAIISGNNTNIVHNSNVISKQQATDICRMNNFALVSHTRNHRYCTNIKPSSYISEFTEDVYTSDLVGVDNSIIVYPYGVTNTYMYDVLEWLGFRLGINIQGNTPNIKNRNKFTLLREEIGFRISIDAIMSKIV